MKGYVDYMDNISVGNELHEKIMERVSRKPATPHRNRAIYRYAGLAACAAVVLLCVWTIPRHFLAPVEVAPDDSNGIISDNDVIIPGEPDEEWGITGSSAQTMPDLTPAQTWPDPPASGAVYHNIDPSQLNNQGDVGRVPSRWYFGNRLMECANNETNINLNNGVLWESGQFEIEDVNNALPSPVNAPVLPDGDYTVYQNVMIDEVTGKIIAYQTTYTYFTVETMMFERAFSVFYFSLDDFMRRDYCKLDEQSENIINEDGEITIHDFPLPPVVAGTTSRVPQKRTLVYINNGIGIVIEAITAPIFIDYDTNTVDETGTLERYLQSDREIISLMKSLIG